MSEAETENQPEAKPDKAKAQLESKPLASEKTSILSSPWLRYGGLSLIVFGLGSFAGHFTADRYGHRAAGQAIQISDKIKGLEADLTTVQSSNSEMRAQLSRLERELKAVPKTQKPAPPPDLSGIEARLSGLENQEPRETQVIDPELLTRLESLQAEGSEALDLADIYARLEALESVDVKQAESIDLSDIETRIVALETARVSPVDIAAPQSGPETTISPVLPSGIQDFPKGALLAALPDESQKGWLQKQITVRGPNDPSLLIEKISDDIFNENWAAAAQKYDRLPANIREIGQDWRDAVQSRL